MGNGCSQHVKRAARSHTVSCPADTQIFRHFRPVWLDERNACLKPSAHGGITFLVSPTGPKTYDFWIYICPPSISFSTRQATRALRDRCTRQVVPFGTISLVEGRPLLDQLISFMLRDSSALPSEAGQMVLDILINNMYFAERLEKLRTKSDSTGEHVEPDTRSCHAAQ